MLIAAWLLLSSCSDGHPNTKVTAAGVTSTTSSTGDFRPAASLYLLPNLSALPPGVALWEAHLYPGETSLTFLDRSQCEGGQQFDIHSFGRPALVAPKPYQPPGPVTNGGGICDYRAPGPPPGALERFSGTSLGWSGPEATVSISGSVPADALMTFAKSLHEVSRSEWIAFARNAPHRSSQDAELGANG